MSENIASKSRCASGAMLMGMATVVEVLARVGSRCAAQRFDASQRRARAKLTPIWINFGGSCVEYHAMQTGFNIKARKSNGHCVGKI